MTHRTVGVGTEHRHLGFEIHELDGWYVGLRMRSQLWISFEAENRIVLEHKIRRWSVTNH